MEYRFSHTSPKPTLKWIVLPSTCRELPLEMERSRLLERPWNCLWSPCWKHIHKSSGMIRKSLSTFKNSTFKTVGYMLYDIHVIFRSELCGYNLKLQYPQPAHFPTLSTPTILHSAASSGKYDAKLTKKQFMRQVQDQLVARLRRRGSEGTLLEHGERLRARDMWKRDLAGRANGTIDPWYQCDLYTEMIAYAINFTFPWCTYPFPVIPPGCSLQDSSCSVWWRLRYLQYP